ncbi:MAG: hypothetical protein ACUVV5_11225 [Candidatus Aminicenantales bacterium]
MKKHFAHFWAHFFLKRPSYSLRKPDLVDFSDVFSITQSVWECGYKIGFALRKKGLTTPTTDLIIAALAMETKSTILHHEEQYERIAQRYQTLHAKHFVTSS